MLRISLIVAILAALLGIGSADPARSSRAVCPKRSSQTFYFPELVLETRPDLDKFVRKWYSRALSAMKEPSLSCGPPSSAEAYRFTWLRTFHHPIVVRVDWSGETGELTSVELDGAGGYNPGRILKSAHRGIPKDDWVSLKTSIERLNFWTMPTALSADSNGLDGAQWIIEGRRAAKYHVVDRWTPQNGAYREVGLEFLRLAGITIPAREMY